MVCLQRNDRHRCTPQPPGKAKKLTNSEVLNQIFLLTALSKSKQVSRPAYVGPQSMTLDRKKMKKKRTTYETTSLLGVDMNSLEAEDLSKARASSMLNISEAASGK